MAADGLIHRFHVMEVSNRVISDIAMEAARLQGMPVDVYKALDAKTREGFHRGTIHTLAALDSLGWTIVRKNST